MTFDVLTPYRYENDRRQSIHWWTLARWQALHTEPIVSGDGNTDGPFCRSRAVNLAAARSDADILIVCDADIAVRYGQVEQMLAALEHSPWVVGYTRMAHLPPAPTDTLLDMEADCHIGALNRRMLRYTSTDSVCGLLAIRAEDYRTIGGMDERFAGWGFEDVAFADKADTLLGPHVRTLGDCVHLHHGLRPDRKTDPSAVANRKLGERYAAAKGDPEAMTALAREALAL